LLLVSIGKGRISEITAPSDNKGNSSGQLGALQSYYPQSPASGSGIFAFSQPTGGIGHIITTTNETARDEVTMSVVEIINGGKVQDFQWNKVEKEDPLTSRNVTTTGPATPIAIWWGDGNESVAHKAVPSNGFQLIDSVLSMGALVQAAVATKDVATAGTYNATWDSADQEGAQLWLVAVQSSVPQASPSPGERNY
jgi:hypothetical protein